VAARPAHGEGRLQFAQQLAQDRRRIVGVGVDDLEEGAGAVDHVLFAVGHGVGVGAADHQPVDRQPLEGAARAVPVGADAVVVGPVAGDVDDAPAARRRVLRVHLRREGRRAPQRGRPVVVAARRRGQRVGEGQHRGAVAEPTPVDQDLLVLEAAPREGGRHDAGAGRKQDGLDHRGVAEGRRQPLHLQGVLRRVHAGGDVERQHQRRRAVQRRRRAGQRQPGGQGQRGAAPAHHVPVFSMLAQGSALGSGSPSCSNSIEMPSGDFTKAMRPSRGGRLMATPAACSFSHMA